MTPAKLTAALFAIAFLTGCVAVQRPDGGSGLAFGVKSEIAEAAVRSAPGGDLLASLLGLGGATTASTAATAYLAGKNKGWDEKAKEGKAG